MKVFVLLAYEKKKRKKKDNNSTGACVPVQNEARTCGPHDNRKANYKFKSQSDPYLYGW